MNLLLLYLLLLKATATSFSGLTSMPVVRNDMVERYHVLTDRQLNAAVAAGRTAPGPNGLYVVGVGYFVAGTPGAIVGALAVMTPAFLIIPMMRYLGARANRPAVKSAIQAVMLAAAGLVIAAAVPLARDALVDPLSVAIALGSFLFLVLTKKDTIWVILGSAAVGLAGKLIG
ncbi:MAG: chromate transporter [Acidobacteria bacterium]|nr:MAG: chromate transporter [Acidobacteriota bacterium]